MTYFDDLTKCSYLRPETSDGQDSDLAIGWLQVGREFPRAIPDPAFVDALVRCCLRPVRLCRGLHDCDLCPPAEASEAWSITHKGRRIRIGNGEVRVQGPDLRWYAAPTMVAHYVMHHEYAPPAPFVAGVLQAAAEIWCLDERQLECLRSLAAAERFDLCLGLVDDLNSRSENPWTSAALQHIRSARAVFLSPSEDGYTIQLLWHRLTRVIPHDEGAEPEAWLRAAVFDVAGILRSAGTPDEEDRNLEDSALLIENLVASGKVRPPW